MRWRPPNRLYQLVDGFLVLYTESSRFSKKAERRRDTERTLIIHLFFPLNAMNEAWERMERGDIIKSLSLFDTDFPPPHGDDERKKFSGFVQFFLFSGETQKTVCTSTKMCFIIVWNIFCHKKGKREFMPPECVDVFIWWRHPTWIFWSHKNWAAPWDRKTD